MVYKGRLPDLPRQPDRQRRIADPAEIDAMLTPQMRAQQPLAEAAERLDDLVHDGKYDGYASIALEHDPPSVVVFWEGPLPQPVQRLVDELRLTVRVEVREAAYSLDELREETERIMALHRIGAGGSVWAVGPLGDCSGLSVMIDRSADLERAKREITSPMKLEFRFGGPIIAA